jgi:Flp pilus assembly protein TadD
MIASLLVATAVSAAPAAATVPTPAAAHMLVVGAEHALRVSRLEQASVMAARALAAGASGFAMDRLLADLAFTKQKYPEALARYQALLRSKPLNPDLLEHGGIAALKLGKLDQAQRMLSAATASPGATWRAWNALGVAADLRGDWVKADQCYDEAEQLAPAEFEPLNNHGWSLALRNKWSAAIPYFERAVALQPKATRARDNLDLARAAVEARLPDRRAGESSESWAARLNDAGLAAETVGDKARATAAFTQALEVSGTWYARAANNLKALANR